MTAAAIPIAAPTSGPAVCPDALAAVHRNRVVSSPSRPTARNAVRVSAPAPTAAARATSPRRGADRLAAVRRIQKIIAVTRHTARTLSRPPSASWPALLSTLTENVSTAAKAAESVTAPSTPSQIGAVDTGASPAPEALARPALAPSLLGTGVLRTAASRMVTTRPASRPSRSPISRLGTLSVQVTWTKVRLTLFRVYRLPPAVTHLIPGGRGRAATGHRVTAQRVYPPTRPGAPWTGRRRVQARRGPRPSARGPGRVPGRRPPPRR